MNFLDPKTVGSPVSLFLYAPVRAFCMCSQIKDADNESLSNMLSVVFMLEKNIEKLLVNYVDKCSVVKREG